MNTFEKRLLAKKVLSRVRLEEAQAVVRQTGRALSDVLIEDGIADEEQVLVELAAQHHLEFVRLSDTDIDPSAVRAVKPKLVAHYGIMPVRLKDGVLTIAVSRVGDMTVLEDIETNLGYQVERVLAGSRDIQELLRRYYGVGAETVERILADTGSRVLDTSVEESHDLEKMAEDASVVRLVNQLIQEAINVRATDVHIEISRDEVTVRRRIDGVLYDTRLPSNIRMLYPAIVSRIKLMSGLDIVERRLPQDGRARVRLGGANYDLRVSVVPAMHGEDIVARILPSTMLFDLEKLGFAGDHLTLLRKLIDNPHGILFVTGPTGSGKSTTLYSCLSRLNTRDRKIITIEDPVEYELRGATQTQINPHIGLTFAKALRSMLRHDPDVMMVGEVRDRETADIAVQTAMTGHMVLSTLHTNDAASSAVRLIDMGVDPYLITSTVLAFMAQRLVRVICPNCKESVEVDGSTLYRGKGCKECRESGYQGRVAICEFLTLEPDIQKLIIAHAPASDIRARADEMGMATLAQDGWTKVAAGMTTAEEVLRVTRA
jgi:type II secretory ATPase GspE/PulE/Tfp pilus assembly ATPase PilB-like protein